jgi:serine/threonine protein phosphatase PrpC
MDGPLPADLRWRWAAASRIGTSHQRLGTRKQDAYGVRLGRALCAVVSDGAGSASHGGQGATLVSRYLLLAFKRWFLDHDHLPDDEDIQCWIDDLRDQLSAIAAKHEVTRRQFAATLVMLVVLDDQLLTLQIGDSALVGRKNSAWEALVWPENGEFASTTFFVTDDPEARLHIARHAFEHDAFALFSDGLEAVALEQATQQPYARFFDPMIKAVDAAEGRGRLAQLSSALEQYLDSPKLCERTDDDKTLVLISNK